MLGGNASTAGIHTVDLFENTSADILVTNTYAGPLAVNLDARYPDSGDTNEADTVDASAMTGALTVTAFGSHVDALDVLIGGVGLLDTLTLTADGGVADLTVVSGFDR